MLLVVSIVLQLLLAALHVVSLRAHWRLSAQHICCQGGEGDSPLRRPQLQRRDVDAGGDGEAAAAAASHHPNSGRGATPSHSSGRSQAKLQQGGGGGGGQRTVAERVLSCKSLFSIFSVLFLLTGLPFRVARLVLLLARPGTVPVHLVAQDSQVVTDREEGHGEKEGSGGFAYLSTSCVAAVAVLGGGAECGVLHIHGVELPDRRTYLARRGTWSVGGQLDDSIGRPFGPCHATAIGRRGDR